MKTNKHPFYYFNDGIYNLKGNLMLGIVYVLISIIGFLIYLLVS